MDRLGVKMIRLALIKPQQSLAQLNLSGKPLFQCKFELDPGSFQLEPLPLSVRPLMVGQRSPPYRFISLLDRCVSVLECFVPFALGPGSRSLRLGTLALSASPILLCLLARTLPARTRRGCPGASFLHGIVRFRAGSTRYYLNRLIGSWVEPRDALRHPLPRPLYFGGGRIGCPVNPEERTSDGTRRRWTTSPTCGRMSDTWGWRSSCWVTPSRPSSE